jgi:predicted MarR family transcription regulator
MAPTVRGGSIELTYRAEEPRVSEFERALFDRLSAFEKFQVLTLLEAGISESVRDALVEVREYQERRAR